MIHTKIYSKRWKGKMAHVEQVILSALHSPAFSWSEKQKVMGSLASLKGIVFSFFVRPEFANCARYFQDISRWEILHVGKNLTIRNVQNVDMLVAVNAGPTKQWNSLCHTFQRQLCVIPKHVLRCSSWSHFSCINDFHFSFNDRARKMMFSFGLST